MMVLGQFFFLIYFLLNFFLLKIFVLKKKNLKKEILKKNFKTKIFNKKKFKKKIQKKKLTQYDHGSTITNLYCFCLGTTDSCTVYPGSCSLRLHFKVNCSEIFSPVITDTGVCCAFNGHVSFVESQYSEMQVSDLPFLLIFICFHIFFFLTFI